MTTSGTITLRHGSLLAFTTGVITVALVIAFLLFPLVSTAQDSRPQPLQELFLTEVVYPQAKGEVQITLATLLDRSRDDRSALMPLAIEYGLTDRWQIEGSWDGYTQFHQNPFRHLRSARASVGTKYSFMNIAGSRAHASIGVDVEFPDAGAFEDQGETEIEYEPVIAAAVDLSRRLTLFGSAGASFAAHEAATLDDAEDSGTLSAGALIALGHVTAAIEYTSRSDSLPWRLGDSPLVTPAIVVHPGGEWELGFGMPIGVRAGARRPGLGIHVIKEFN